ncbi:MAG: bifunctional methylenetetrahydrofolate dehydrogenase/methenyltetrahydrofolate cyclohydrolase FolD [Candidatus Jordarchaeum sp.]|uniref:bifunctional methylenetetrahydrofolate dehydrogenase/methenyltetrahydrofolate cyclohydrolase FolD n=1 Tax=Candidatus Jordarchaeum sp. TaxID=2823881 RepID=UPI004049C5D4
MVATIIDGKKIADSIEEEIIEETKELIEKHGVTPGLAVILVGSDPGSQIYVNIKRKACSRVTFHFEDYLLPDTVEEKDLINLIKRLNEDDKIHGILVQLPLPKHLDENNVISAISPEKDVDGLHPVSAGKLLLKQEGFVANTPAGILEMLRRSNIDVKGKDVVIVNRSKIVGRPLMVLLINNDATVTVCHTKTRDLKAHMRSADILVVAVGKPNFVTEDMVKEGAIVIDVGINRVEGKLCGDVDFEKVKEKASYITPVPGGVGPLTVVMLMKNVLHAARRSLKK